MREREPGVFTGLGGEFIVELSNTNVSVPATAGGYLVMGVIYGGQPGSSCDPRARPSIRINIRLARGSFRGQRTASTSTREVVRL